METPETCLAEVAGRHGFVESLLDLVVDELDEGIVLFREFLLQDLVILGPHLLHPLVTHPLGNHAHLFESEYGFIRVLGRGHSKAASTSLNHVSLHHGFRRGRGRARRWRALAFELPPLLEALHLIPKVVCDLLGSQGRLFEF